MHDSYTPLAVWSLMLLVATWWSSIRRRRVWTLRYAWICNINCIYCRIDGRKRTPEYLGKKIEPLWNEMGQSWYAFATPIAILVFSGIAGSGSIRCRKPELTRGTWFSEMLYAYSSAGETMVLHLPVLRRYSIFESYSWWCNAPKDSSQLQESLAIVGSMVQKRNWQLRRNLIYQ